MDRQGCNGIFLMTAEVLQYLQLRKEAQFKELVHLQKRFYSPYIGIDVRDKK